MLILNDYVCTNQNCLKYSKVVELLVEKESTPVCEECNMLLNKEMPAPRGKVPGSINPVKQ